MMNPFLFLVLVKYVRNWQKRSAAENNTDVLSTEAHPRFRSKFLERQKTMDQIVNICPYPQHLRDPEPSQASHAPYQTFYRSIEVQPTSMSKCSNQDANSCILTNLRVSNYHMRHKYSLVKDVLKSLREK